MVELELPFPPSVNSIWRRGAPKRGQRASRKAWVYLDPTYKAWRKEADLCIIESRRQGKGRVAGRFIASITLDDRRRVGRVDCDNFCKAIMDCLQRMLVIDDDTMADKITVEWGKANGVKVKVTPCS